MPIERTLESRTAIVTGAARGIGRAIAVRLAAAGASVAINDVAHVADLESTAELLRGMGCRTVVVPGDVSVEADVERIVGEALDEFGGLDVLVNNAAIVDIHGNWNEISLDAWDRVQAVNLKSCFLMLRACHDSLAKSDAGRIVNISSITAFTGQARTLHYASSKGGMISFTRSLARELGPESITVNAVVPGAIRTEAEVEMFGDLQEAQWILEQQSVKRRGTGDDVAAAVAFFASDEAAFITGQSLMVDGGWVMR
jgi:3-oxoacyl-[acyl-carrier protein] reductase